MTGRGLELFQGISCGTCSHHQCKLGPGEDVGGAPSRVGLEQKSRISRQSWEFQLVIQPGRQGRQPIVTLLRPSRMSPLLLPLKIRSCSGRTSAAFGDWRDRLGRARSAYPSDCVVQLYCFFLPNVMSPTLQYFLDYCNHW